ncbi:endodeoxyribonuclease [Apophysomyces sp. BC1015]|nr:endodeoxyribonuclease [Apophysomyces sp. BC1015]
MNRRTDILSLCSQDLSVEIACDSSAKRYIEQDDEALFILDSQDISPSFVASQFSTCPEVQESRIMVNRSIASILNPSDYKVDTAKDNRLVGTSQAPQPQLTVPDPEPRDLQERTIQHDISRFDLESQLYTQQYTPGTMAQPRETLMTDIESTLLPMWEMIRDQKPLEVAVFSRASRSAIQARYLRVLEIIYEAVSFNVMMTKREVFYKDVELFENQTVVDKIIDDICCHYNVPRFSLNITAASRGLIYGPAKITLKNSRVIDCTVGPNDLNDDNCIDEQGFLIPAVNQIEQIECASEVIIIVEKEASFRQIVSAGFRRSSINHCLFITGRGYPVRVQYDIATRHMVKYLATQYPQTPILALVDNDPYGLDIYSVYKWGSQAQAFDQANLAVPQIQLLGLTHQDRKE